MMTPRRRWQVAVGAGLLAAGAAVLALRPGARTDPGVGTAPTTGVRGNVAASLPATSASHDGCVFERGERLTYALALEAKTQLRVPSAPEPVQMDLKLSGNLTFEVLQADAREATLLARLTELKHTATDAFRAGSMGQPFLVAISDSCQLTRFAREQSVPKPDARNQQALLWEAQFETTAPAFAMQNGTGTATARMERIGPQELQRTFDRYESLWAAGSSTATSNVLGVRLGGPWFQSLEAEERLENPDTRVRASLTLRRLDAALNPFTDHDRNSGHYVWENLLPKARFEMVKRPVTTYDAERRAKVAPLELDQALGQFAERVKGRVGIHNIWPELAAYFEVHPDAIRPAVQKYLSGELPPETGADFFLALGKTRTPEAKTQLMELKGNEQLDSMDTVRSMFALVLREDVGVDLATSLAQDIRRHSAANSERGAFLSGEAMLALGMLGGLRDDAKLTEISRNALTDVLRSEQPGSHAAATALAAIGNTGDIAALGAALPFMRDNDPSVRKAATSALGRMPPAETESLAIDWLRRETDSRVKTKLYSMLQQQHFDQHIGASRTLVEQALTDIKTTRSAVARKHIVRLIAQSAISQEREIREALKSQARFEHTHRTGLLSEFKQHLTRAEIDEVLK